MAKANNKTQKTEGSVKAFIATISDAKKRADSEAILKLMGEVTKHEPKMWGSAIIGFGDRHLVYESGREMDWFHIGFSPRKQYLSFYISGALKNPAIEKLGKYTTSKGCLYIKSLEDVDQKILKKLIADGYKAAQKETQ
jgi:hypothetical protein